MKALLKRAFPDTGFVRLAYHRLKNSFAPLFAGNPSRSMTVISVTGTDGKTTTVAMIAHILHCAGKKTCAVSTAFFQIGGKREANPTQKTSVDAGSLQKFLLRAKNEGCTHAVIEASSHGLLQGRLSGITPQVAAVTNVTMEHLDYHGTMREYMAAKALLFRSMHGKGTKVLNKNDQSYDTFLSLPSEKTFAYGPKEQISDVRADNASVSGTLRIDDASVQLSLPMPGAFNLENALCAIVSSQAVGIDPSEAARSLSSFQGAGGRMERIDAGQPYHVFVDFTVTPAAYEQTLKSARQIAGPHRLLVLTGSCGDRMREKRPLVGKLCATLADITVITNEDPYTEDPERIIDDVLSGVPKDVTVFRDTHSANGANLPKFCLRLSDRMESIRYILKTAQPGDVVLLCGKGSDVTMMVASGQIPWNEKEIVETEIKQSTRV